MKYLLPACVMLSLDACQAAETDTVVDTTQTQTVEAPAATAEFRIVPKDGDITISVMDLVAEPRNCIVPIRVENGTDTEVAVSMFSFTITGPGEDAGANMFAQPTPPGQYRESRIILPGQTCDEFDTILPSDVQCKSDGEDCAAKVEFSDGGGLAFEAP